MRYYILLCIVLVSCGQSKVSAINEAETVVEVTVDDLPEKIEKIDASIKDDVGENELAKIEVNPSRKKHTDKSHPPTVVEEKAKEVVVMKKNVDLPLVLDQKEEVEIKQVIKVDNTVAEKVEALPDDVKAEAKVEAEIQVEVDLTSAWDQMLKKYVSASGKVNYKGFKTSERELDSYLQLLSDNPPAADWNKKRKLSYWINVYNAHTIKLIVKNYPIKSIMELNGGKPWDDKGIKIGSNTYSLNNIENDIIRPRFNDGRIHFAVNCAAKSCPPLWNRAWTADNLNPALASRTKKFINDPSYNTLGAAPKISKIFEWYGADFGDLTVFLNKYAVEKIASDAAISFGEYNWDLNE